MGPKLMVVVISGLVFSLALFSVKPSFGGIDREADKNVSRVSDSTASPGTEINNIINNLSEERSMRWLDHNPQVVLKGVALVIHGLNLRPDKMQPIISKLTESGMDVLQLSLRGHGENYDHRNGIDPDKARLQSFKSVSHQLWANEAYLAYYQLKKRGADRGVPLFLAAFSIGGLIGLDLLAFNSGVRFDKLLLFAPALRLHAFFYLERVLSPFPSLVIPSMAPKKYLANPAGTPIAAYNALFDGLNRFNQYAGPKLNVPTLIIIDQQDEFIPLSKLKKLVKDMGWKQWHFFIVEKDQSADEDSFYHHVIDASSTGRTVWRDMMRAAVEHLLEPPSRYFTPSNPPGT